MNLLSRIRHSILIEPIYPQTHQKRKRFLNNLILHFRPLTVPESTLKFTLSWGLGGMAAVLVMLQIGTGLLLKFVYEPFPAKAYASIITLQNDVLFGQFIRNIHHWSANLLVVIVFLHLLRVFFTSAFHSPRQFNWIIGLSLFFLVLCANFTGYLLPWDRLAYWAITICTGMLEYIPGVGIWLQKMIRGGSEIGPVSLRIFFTIHTAVIPVCLVILMAFHFWRVRRTGGLVIPRPDDENPASQPGQAPTIPNLIIREVAVGLVLIASIMLLSVFFNAPLEDQANPGLSPNPTKAPWYFLGIQEMLLHLHPIFAVLVIPVLVIGALVFLPYVTYQSNSAGVWFVSRIGRRMATIAAITALVATPLLIIGDEFLFDFTAWMPGVPHLVSNGLVPVAIVLVGVIGFYLLMKRKYAAANNEVIQTLFVLLVVSFIMLTVTGIWFRGAGMALMWPWEMK